MTKSRKLWIARGVVLLGVIAYMIWRNRGIDVPEVDESLFALERRAIPEEENLLHTLKNNGLEEISQLFESVFEQGNAFFKAPVWEDHLYDAEFLQLKSQLPEGIFQGNHARLELERKRTQKLTLDELFARIQEENLLERLAAIPGFESIITAIEEQAYFNDHLWEDLFGGGVTKGMVAFSKGLAILSLYEMQNGNFDQTFRYWKAIYLLGDKISQEATMISYLIGWNIQNDALELLHYMMWKFELSEQLKAQYAEFLTIHEIHAQEKLDRAWKHEYHMMSNLIRKYGNYDLQFDRGEVIDALLLGRWEDVAERMLPRSKLYDVEEILKIYRYAMANGASVNLWTIDRRFDRVDEHGDSDMTLSKLFWRKNSMWMQTITAILPRLEGLESGVVSIEAYRAYLLEQLKS